MKRLIASFTPPVLLCTYHFLLAFWGALRYGFPSRKLIVVGVTGTKGKSSTAEFINAIFEAAGYTTALASTIRFKIGSDSRPNMLKMTMPGRSLLQKLLREAVDARCTHAVIEMTSEGVKQFRHKFIELDALVFTNISPEHIESHGSFEKYLNAKLALARALRQSPKKNKVMVANSDDPYGELFLDTAAVARAPFSLHEVTVSPSGTGMTLSYRGATIRLALEGVFNAYNALAAIRFTEHIGIPFRTIREGLERVTGIPGRVEHIHEGQPFDIVIDYAHTPNSIEQVCGAFSGKRKICVFGATGGGRDTWKRPEMGRIAEAQCESVILTNDDPYDEDPERIVEDIARGMKARPAIMIDRRLAIREALMQAAATPKNTVVLILGKGTDPYLMEAGGKKTPWSDARIVREELAALPKKRR